MSLIIASSDNPETLGVTPEAVLHSTRRRNARALGFRRNDGERGNEDRDGTPSVQLRRALGRTDGDWSEIMPMPVGLDDAAYWELVRADEDLDDIELHGTAPRTHVADATVVCDSRQRSRRRRRRTRRVVIDMTGLGSLMTERHGVPL